MGITDEHKAQGMVRDTGYGTEYGTEYGTDYGTV